MLVVGGIKDGEINYEFQADWKIYILEAVGICK